METKTCPHCNEAAIRASAGDIDDFGSVYFAYVCTDCGSTFLIPEEEDKDEAV